VRGEGGSAAVCDGVVSLLCVFRPWLLET